MVQELLVCPYCRIRVWPTRDGDCPSCRRKIVVPSEVVGPGRTEAIAAIPVEECESQSPAPNQPSGHYCRTCRRELQAAVGVCSCGVPPNDGYNYCPACGHPTYVDETECPACAAALPKHAGVHWIPPRAAPISPASAAVFSLILPGLGQMCLGQGKKGVLFLLPLALGALATWKAGTVSVPLVAPVALAMLAVLAVLDAALVAEKLSAGKAVREWESSWWPGTHNSRPGGSGVAPTSP